MAGTYPFDDASWQRAAIAYAGRIFFVDDSDANDSDNPSSGTFQTPFTTLAYALTQCTAGVGDTVYAKPGHSQTLAQAQALTPKTGVSLVMAKFGAAWTMGTVAGSLETMGDSRVTTRGAAALPQTAAAALFTVTGLVRVLDIVGYVTVAIGAIANATKLQGNSTGAGATTDLCATVDLNAAAIDTRYEITGTFANAMLATIDLPKARTMVVATELDIPPGTIDLNCAGSDGGTGRMRWSVTYRPREVGARIVAA